MRKFEKKQRAFSMSLTRGVVTAVANASAVELAALMDKHNIGAIVIMKGEKLVGIVSERDITRRVVAKNKNPKTTKAKNFMTKDVITAEFSEGLDSIYQKLCQSKFRHLPITHRKKLVGIASQRDVLYGVVSKSMKKV